MHSFLPSILCITINSGGAILVGLPIRLWLVYVVAVESICCNLVVKFYFTLDGVPPVLHAEILLGPIQGVADATAGPPYQAALPCAASATTAATAPTAAMASPTVLTFDADGRAVAFDVWVDDLQLFLQCDSRDGVSLSDHTSSVSTAPAAIADSTVRLQWTTCDAVARLAVRSHLPPAERAHFGQYKTAHRLMLPYHFPDLAAFATVADLVAQLRTSDTRYRAALPTEFYAKNPPPPFTDQFLSLCPNELTVDLLEERLAAAEKSILTVGASRGDRRTPFFEGCSPVPLLPSVASAAAVDLVGTEEVGAASAPSGRRRNSKGKRSKGGGGGGGRGGEGGGGSGGCGGGSGGGGGGSSSGGGGGGSGGTGRGAAAQRGANSSRAPVRPRRPSSFVSGTLGVGGLGVLVPALTVPPDPGIAAAALGASASAAPGTGESAAPGAGESALSGTAPTEALHTFTLDSSSSHSFFRDSITLTPLSRPIAVSLADLSGGSLLAHSSTVLPCPAAPSGLLSGLHLPSFSTNLVSGADLQDAWVDQFAPGGQRVTHCTCSRTGRHLATFTRRPGSSLYTLTTAPPPVSASCQVAPSSQVFAAESRSSPAYAPCSCCPLSHKTLLWHHRLGHPSLPHLRGMASRSLVSGLPWCLPSLPPGPAPTCVPCVEGRQRAAPHSSSFPLTEAPLQTLHMDVWGPARVFGQDHERYFLLVVDNYSRYTTVFRLRSKGEVLEVLIDWIRGARRQLSERFGSDLSVLRPTAARGAEGIRQTFTLPASPQQNGIAQRRIGMVMDVARTSMIHAAAPHFRWPFAVQFTSDQPSASCLLARDHSYSAGPAPSGVSQVDPAEPVEVAVDSGAAGGAEPAGAKTGGEEPRGAELEHVEPGGAEPERVEPGGAVSGSAESGGSPRVSLRWVPLSLQRLREWYARRCHCAAGAGATGGAASAGAARGAAGTAGGSAGAGAAGGAVGAKATGGAAGAGGTGGSTGAGAAGGAAGAGTVGGTTDAGAAGASGPRGARTEGTRAAGGGGTAGVGTASTLDGGGVGVVAGDSGAEGTGVVSAISRGTARPRPYYVPLLQ
ncbi:unnamed protein product [Closterium sp. NIES-54]